MNGSLIIPAFIAGFFTFLAPCTLPLVPAYLAFISGVSLRDGGNRSQIRSARQAIFFNGVMYALGFSVVFIFFGVLFGLGGAALVKYKYILQRVGGVVVIFFGLYMMNVIRFPALRFLESEKHFPLARLLKPGKPLNSFLFGATFAFGWTPCIGPILGSILTLAASSATVGTGALLLAIFSLGLALPFLGIALCASSADLFIGKIQRYLQPISFIGGLFLVFIGILLVMNNLGPWIASFYRVFHFLPTDALLNYL